MRFHDLRRNPDLSGLGKINCRDDDSIFHSTSATPILDVGRHLGGRTDLHNGSVPTLTQLLTPAHQRVSEFVIGAAYDIDKVGLAVHQTKFNFTLKTDCSDRNSGDSHCGHDYGTSFSDADKKALLEYLKSL